MVALRNTDTGTSFLCNADPQMVLNNRTWSRPGCRRLAKCPWLLFAVKSHHPFLHLAAIPRPGAPRDRLAMSEIGCSTTSGPERAHESNRQHLKQTVQFGMAEDAFPQHLVQCDIIFPLDLAEEPVSGPFRFLGNVLHVLVPAVRIQQVRRDKMARAAFTLDE
ncbi:unnamed protein product [Sphagnum tenellum]